MIMFQTLEMLKKREDSGVRFETARHYYACNTGETLFLKNYEGLFSDFPENLEEMFSYYWC